MESEVFGFLIKILTNDKALVFKEVSKWMKYMKQTIMHVSHFWSFAILCCFLWDVFIAETEMSGCNNKKVSTWPDLTERSSIANMSERMWRSGSGSDLSMIPNFESLSPVLLNSNTFMYCVLPLNQFHTSSTRDENGAEQTINPAKC